MIAKKKISVLSAKHIEHFAIDITFSNGKTKRVDFGTFLLNNSHPQYDKYKKPDHFKKFYIDRGNLVWGKNWDLIFPVEQLYKGKVF
jgi:hypothetical protein